MTNVVKSAMYKHVVRSKLQAKNACVVSTIEKLHDVTHFSKQKVRR